MFNFKNIFGTVIDNFKSQYIPTKDNKLRLTWGGAVAVPDPKNEGSYIAFDKNGKAFRYPEAMTMKMPVFFISRTVDQLKPGDIIKQGTSYYHVTGSKDGKIFTRGFSGFTHTVIPVEDVLIGGSYVPVAINLFGMFGNGQTNPVATATAATSNPGGIFGNLFGGALGGNMGGIVPLMMMSKLFGGDKSEKTAAPSEFHDEFCDMDRHELKLYQQKNGLGLRIVPSMEDEDIRNAIRKKLGMPTSESAFESDDMMQMIMLSQFAGGNQVAGMNPLALMMLSGQGGDSDSMMMLLVMQQLGALNPASFGATAAPAATETQTAAPAPEPIDMQSEEEASANA